MMEVLSMAVIAKGLVGVMVVDGGRWGGLGVGLSKF